MLIFKLEVWGICLYFRNQVFLKVRVNVQRLKKTKDTSFSVYFSISDFLCLDRKLRYHLSGSM